MQKKIGIIGAGQLGKMLIESGIKWNLKFNVLGTESICDNLAHKKISGSLHDEKKIRELAEISDVLTFEIENINCDALLKLEKEGKKIIPSPTILKMIQDKGQQKTFYASNEVPTARFEIVTGGNHVKGFSKDDLVVIKPCKGGYDGRGVFITLLKDFKFEDGVEYVIEEFIKCEKEVSVIIARNHDRTIECYPPVEMVLNDQNMLDYQICPANLDPEIEQCVQLTAIDTIEKMNGVGIFAVEMFIPEQKRVLVNEVSPRPHNSGHHTIEAFQTSQFEQLTRILLDLPLGPTEPRGKSIMLNLLGPENHIGNYKLLDTNLLCEDNCHVHIYGKQPSKPFRKLGHVTIIAQSMDQLLEKYAGVKAIAQFVPDNDQDDQDDQDDQHAPLVGVIMGSISDLPVLEEAINVLKEFEIPHQVHIISAHRTPTRMFSYAQSASDRGLKVIIAGAGGAAHLPGMTAALTNLPVIGVPVKTSTLSGIDSLYSIVQMPRGIPVATTAINGAKNAGLLAVRILAINDTHLTEKLSKSIKDMSDSVLETEITVNRENPFME